MFNGIEPGFHRPCHRLLRAGMNTAFMPQTMGLICYCAQFFQCELAEVAAMAVHHFDPVSPLFDIAAHSMTQIPRAIHFYFSHFARRPVAAGARKAAFTGDIARAFDVAFTIPSANGSADMLGLAHTAQRCNTHR